MNNSQLSIFNSQLTKLLLVLLSINTVYAQQPVKKESPKLVVTITIDQLRSDYLQLFLDGFGERGFKRLLREGLVFNDVRFEFPSVDKSSASATIFSGATPFYHGIVSDKIYDRKQKKELSSLYDSRFMGNYTSETLSPSNLLAATVGDALKGATAGMSDVFSIAPDYQAAILSAGHAANAAYWLDDLNGHWATTTFFKNLPWYVDQYNTKESLASRITTLSWGNMYPADRYNYFPYVTNNGAFQYQYKNYDRFRAIKTSALVNEEVTRLAERFFENASFGKKNVPDLFALSYYAGMAENRSIRDYTVELQDTYFRLDKELEKLFNLIDKKVGLKNTLIVLTSTGYFRENEKPSEQVNIPLGEFHPKRSIALLNMYLMAIYGEGNWIEHYYNNQLFFNKKLIEDKRVSMAEMQRKSADFLSELSGVQDVFTAYDIYHEKGNADFQQIRNGFHKNISGDLLLEIRPGWKVLDENGNQINSDSKYSVQNPLIILHPDFAAKTIQQKIRATQITPSICYILRIRPPNAAFDDVLLEVK